MGAVGGDDVAELIFFLDDRLGCEGSTGTCSRTWLLGHDQLAGDVRADHDVARCGRGEISARELERDDLGQVVGEVCERGDPVYDGGRERSQEWTVAAGERYRDDRAVIAGDDVVELIFFVDYGLRR